MVLFELAQTPFYIITLFILCGDQGYLIS